MGSLCLPLLRDAILRKELSFISKEYLRDASSFSNSSTNSDVDIYNYISNQFTFCLLLGGSVDARLENMYFTSRGIREVKKKRKETIVFFINVKFKYKFVVIEFWRLER